MSTSIFFEHLVQEDRVHRSIYTDPMIFELEMTHIYGGVWCYLAHESQLPRADDYLTGKLGLRPIIVARDNDRDRKSTRLNSSHVSISYAVFCLKKKKKNKKT